MAPHESTNWIPGLLMFGAGAIGATAYLLFSKVRHEPAAPETAEDYEARYQGLLAELKEHVANKALLPEVEWAAERARLEAAAAAVLRERDVLKHQQTKATARAEKVALAAAATGGGGSTLRGALIGGAVVLFFGGLGLMVSDNAKPRVDGMTATGGDTVGAARGPMAGQMPPQGGPAGAMPGGPDDPKLAKMIAAVQASPNDCDALADVSLYLLRLQGFEDAKPFVQRATSIDPFHVRTRVARSLLEAVDGPVAPVQDELERMAKLYPEAYDAHLFAGLLAMDENDPSRAVESFDAYLAVAPPGDVPPMLKMGIEQIRQQQAGQPK